MLHQIEFLLEGYLLPVTVGEFRVSENLVLEAVWPKSNEPKTNYAIAYVAVEEEGYYFKTAIDYVEFFVLNYSLVSGQPVTFKMGAGTLIEDLDSLGKKRVSFANFEKLYVEGNAIEDVLSKPFFDAIKTFLELFSERQKIMDGSLGIALAYYYFAVLASQRRLEEVVINLMIAGEALLITESDTICGPLSRRLATLIAKNEAERKLISKKMLKLYSVRSGIVHGRGKKPTVDETSQLLCYVKEAIDAALSKRTLSKEELVKKLDCDWYASGL